MPIKQSPSAGKAVFVLPWIIVVIVAVLAIVYIHRIDTLVFHEHGEHSPLYVSVSGVSDCLSKVSGDAPLQANEIKLCLESAKAAPQVMDAAVNSRIDELKWILTAIASLGAFFAIAQGAAAWFSAQAYTKQAEDSLKVIRDVQEGVRSQYPLFEAVQQKRDQAFADLAKVFGEVSRAPDANAGSTEALDWKDNLYRILGVDKRQLLLSVESFVSIDLHPGPLNWEEHADMLRKVGLFYRSKFQFEDGLGYGAFCDLERGEAYLQLANEKASDFTMKNDLGSLYMTLFVAMRKKKTEGAQKEASRALARAEETFNRSIKMEARQQRAWYNLAVIYARYHKNYAAAIEKLTEALTYPWQREPSVYMKSILHYNIACYHSRELQEQISSGKLTAPITLSRASEVLKHLRTSAELGLVRLDIVEGDFALPGSPEETETSDITGLIRLGDSALVGELASIKAELIAKAPQTRKTSPEPKKLREVLVEAYSLIKSKLKL